MTDSIRDDLDRDLESADLLVRLLGVTGTDRRVFELVVESTEPVTVDELAAMTDRDRSTMYRSAQRLVDANCLRKETVPSDDGGYHHRYLPESAPRIAARMYRTLNDWYAELDRAVREFRRSDGTSRL